MATHSSVLAWRIPGMGKPGGLPSMGSHRVGHDWSDLAAAAACFLFQLFYSSHLTGSFLLFMFLVTTLTMFIHSSLQFSYHSYLLLFVSHQVMSNSLRPCGLTGSSVHDISQAGMLAWVGISFSREYSWSRARTHVSCIGRWILYHWAIRKARGPAKRPQIKQMMSKTFHLWLCLM